MHFKRRAAALFLLMVVPGLVLLSPGSASAGGKKPYSPSFQTVAISIYSGKANLTISIKGSVPAGAKKISSIKVSAGGKSCTVKGGSGTCVVKGIKWGKTVSASAVSRNSSGSGPTKKLSLGPDTKYWSVATGPCTIVGTSGPDTITGTERDDRICGLEGDDVIYGLNGNDRLYGGAGDDELFGGGEPVEVQTEASAIKIAEPISDGSDYLNGEDGDDVLDGGFGSDDECTGGSQWWLESDEFDIDSCGDITAPVVTHLEFDKTTVDTSNENQVINLTVCVKDDFSGISSGEHFLFHPRSGQNSMTEDTGLSSQFNLASRQPNGDELEACYEGGHVLRRGSAKGLWEFGLQLTDYVGNYVDITPAKIASTSPDSQTTITQTAPGDVRPPIVTSLNISPQTISTATQDQLIEVELCLWDQSGIGSGEHEFRNSSTGQTGMTDFEGYVMRLDDDSAIDNNPGDDEFTECFKGVHKIRKGASKGRWDFNLDVWDVFGNEAIIGRKQFDKNYQGMGLQTYVNQTAPGDVTKPKITSLKFTPTTINTTESEQKVEIEICVEDPSGISSGEHEFRHSKTGQTSTWYADSSFQLDDNSRISGDRFKGCYSGGQLIRKRAAKGFWEFRIDLYDQLGNGGMYKTGKGVTNK